MQNIGLASMVESFSKELAAGGLRLNTSKTKILTTQDLKQLISVASGF